VLPAGASKYAERLASVNPPAVARAIVTNCGSLAMAFIVGPGVTSASIPKARTILIGNAILLAMNMEAMQMHSLPGKNNLENLVQVGKKGTTRQITCQGRGVVRTARRKS
jgi:hypothetical protein